ncbi:MAG: hypothetical protein Q4G69_12700 [Planctomycetia bacterium]|nr:hypothetical protein [Planctomycetia bacterium]
MNRTEKIYLTITAILAAAVFFGNLLFPKTGYSWGGGHDFITQMLADNIPENLQNFFNDENRKQFVQWSHYPDVPYKSPADIEKIVGKRDVDLMVKHGLKNSGWMHSNWGQVCSLAGLVLAFRENNSQCAAFYISELSHSISDEGALNHTPMNNFLECIVVKGLAPIPYSQLKDVKLYPNDLGSCGPIAKKIIDEKIKKYQPKILAKNFPDFLYSIMLTEGDAGAMASNVEEAVTYAKDPQIHLEGQVRIGTWQIELLLDMIETARYLGSTSCAVEIPKNFESTLHKMVQEDIQKFDIKNDSYCRDLFDKSKESAGRPVQIGLLLEPYSYWSHQYQTLSFLGALLTSGSGRVLWDAGYGIIPLNLQTVLKNGLPKCEDVPLLVLSSGHFRNSKILADHLRKYLAEGGKILWIGGDDPVQLTNPIANHLKKRADNEIPTSTKWSLQNEDVLDKMVISFDGPMKITMGSAGYKFYKNPNINGFAKPRCQYSIDLSNGNDPNQKIDPLAWLDNGKEKFCIAAGTKKIVWLPEYLVSPYTLSQDDKIGYFPQMRLDSFGRSVVLAAVRYLIDEPIPIEKKIGKESLNEEIGKRPYEMDWAHRTEDDNPPLIDFENFGKWTVETKGSAASFEQSREQQIFGKYTAKLTYRKEKSAKNPEIIVRPGNPISVPDQYFDAVSCWICGNNWAWVDDPSTPRIRVFLLFNTPDGKELPVKIATVRWKEWFLCHYRFNEDQQKLLNQKGTVFSGIRITDGNNTDNRSIWIDNIALFKEQFKPLKFTKRPRRGIEMFSGQDPGQNTGEGRLPFPTREETILPINKDHNAKNMAEESGQNAQWTYNGSDGQLKVVYEPKTGTWSDLRVKWDQSDWFSPIDQGGINFLVNEQGEREPVEQRILKDRKFDGSVLKTSWILKSKTVSTAAEYHFQLIRKTLVLDTFAKGGKVREVDFGKITGFSELKMFKVPYYSYGEGGRPYAARINVNGSAKPLFVMAHMDWYRSNASTIFGAKNGREKGQINGSMIYAPKTDGKRNDVYERFFIAISPDFEEVLPEIPNPISPWKHITGKKVWRAHGANPDRQNDYRFWFNIWRHGIREVVITDHEVGWRDGGESFTFRVKAAPKKGGDKGMFDYARFLQDQLHFTYGPYNNFTDFAPVNGYWNYDMISRHSDKQLQHAWARCYAPKPSRAVEYCEKLTPIIQNKFHFSTAYCDVHTSVTPWSRTDYDARVPGAGTFAAVYYPYGEIMLIQKKNWNGPVYSEGPHQCFYCGLTDGNYAQDRGYYIPGEPWLLDFDLRKIHDHECNFGIGDPSMYDPKLSEHRPQTQEEIHQFTDRYFAAMIAFGHPGFLTTNFGNEIAVKSYFMVQPIASYYTQVSAEKIWYLDREGNKQDISQVLANGIFSENRHLITYTDGTFAAVNANPEGNMFLNLEEPFEMEDAHGNLVKTKKIDLVPNGYFCRSGDGKVLVCSNAANGSKFDYSVGPEGIYFNGRGKFHRTSLAAGSADGVCRYLKDGKYEIIVLNNKELGFKIDADSAIALSFEDQKELGPAPVRKSRGYVYVQPVNGAFSYRLEKSGKNTGVKDLELDSNRFFVAPGEKVSVYVKSDPSRTFEVEIPSTARPNQNLWFEPVQGSWINFAIVEPREMHVSFEK